jgi:hypothetical protein
VNSNNKEKLSCGILPIEGNQPQANKIEDEDHNIDYSHRGENSDSKNNTDIEELDNENLKSNLKSRIQEGLKKQEEEQKILLKQNKQNIIDFVLDNKDSIRVEDLKISEPFYKCYREKGNCIICNSLSNIICTNCCNNHKEIWLCINHWQQHKIEKHE